MTPADVHRCVMQIQKLANDDNYEDAHLLEDELYLSVLSAIADGSCDNPAECARTAIKAAKIDFSRYHA